MKSSSGTYYIGLDHVRGLAAFFVFSWHFIHAREGQLAGPPVPPLSLLAEGHTGVALFMCLSGYLFAKLLDGKEILYRPFLYNRLLRLAPLLVVALLGVGIERHLTGEPLGPFLRDIATGLVLPTLPQGGWSITVGLPRAPPRGATVPTFPHEVHAAAPVVRPPSSTSEAQRQRSKTWSLFMTILVSSSASA